MVDASGACSIAAELGNKATALRFWQQELRQESAHASVGQRRLRDENLLLLP